MRLADKFRRQDRSQERGVTMVLVAVAMVAIIAMAAMSIDLVTLYLAREEAQRAADSAALAAARVISVSGITGTANPGNNPGYWGAICGPTPTGWATQAALSAAAQNSVGGNSVSVSVNYSDGSSTVADCSTLSAAFAVNPLVIVKIVPTSIPSFFSRIWGIAGSSISASATAEVFNPSASNVNGIAPGADVTPVEPRCVKPWIVPNLDPGNPPNPIVSLTNGQIQHAGISTDGSGLTGIIGETFNLFADCGPTTTTCLGGLPSTPSFHPTTRLTPTYLAAWGIEPISEATHRQCLLRILSMCRVPCRQTASAFSAVPSCAPGTDYGSAVAGCDQTTVYQCGQQMSSLGNPNMVDLSENPGGPAGDSALGVACSLTGNASIPLSGQDNLRNDPYPFVVLTGAANPLRVATDTPVTSSNSIVSLPIYDGNGTTPLVISTNTAPVTIVGFLQVFVNSVDQTNGSINVTVLNVAGCGSSATTNPPVFGSSPLPVRLITH